MRFGQGHVCIDLTASHDKVIDMRASDGAVHAAMGEKLIAARNDHVTLDGPYHRLVRIDPSLVARWQIDHDFATTIVVR